MREVGSRMVDYAAVMDLVAAGVVLELTYNQDHSIYQVRFDFINSLKETWPQELGVLKSLF